MIIRWKMAQFFEAWWWKRYLRNRPVDAYLAWKKDYWQLFLEKGKIEVSPNEKILDAGCGPAGIFMMFPKNKVVAIDPLLENYQSQLPHFQTRDYPNVHFENKGLEQFYVKSQFEIVFCLNAINHVADLDKSIKNLCGAVKKGGIFYLSIDAHNFVFLKKLFRLIPGDILHPHQLDLKEYQSLVEANKINIIETNLIMENFIFNYYLIKGIKE